MHEKKNIRCCAKGRKINLKPFPKRPNLDISEIKEFADNNLKLDGNERKPSKGLENTVGKREIARYEQFLLFPHCFQISFTADT